MKKRKRIQKHRLLKRKKRILRKKVRFEKVVDGLGLHLSIKDIHFKTGLAEKTIRKIIRNNSEDLTFLLLKKQYDVEDEYRGDSC